MPATLFRESPRVVLLRRIFVDSKMDDRLGFSQFSSQLREDSKGRRGRRHRKLSSETPLTLDPALTEIVTVNAATLHQVLRLVWVYIKSNELLLDGSFVSLDSKLGAVVGTRSMLMPAKVVMARVMRHIESTVA